MITPGMLGNMIMPIMGMMPASGGISDSTANNINPFMAGAFSMMAMMGMGTANAYGSPTVMTMPNMLISLMGGLPSMSADNADNSMMTVPNMMMPMMGMSGYSGDDTAMSSAMPPMMMPGLRGYFMMPTIIPPASPAGDNAPSDSGAMMALALLLKDNPDIFSSNNEDTTPQPTPDDYALPPDVDNTVVLEDIDNATLPAEDFSITITPSTSGSLESDINIINGDHVVKTFHSGWEMLSEVAKQGTYSLVSNTMTSDDKAIIWAMRRIKDNIDNNSPLYNQLSSLAGDDNKLLESEFGIKNKFKKEPEFNENDVQYHLNKPLTGGNNEEATTLLMSTGKLEFSKGLRAMTTLDLSPGHLNSVPNNTGDNASLQEKAAQSLLIQFRDHFEQIDVNNNDWLDEAEIRNLAARSGNTRSISKADFDALS